MTAEASDDELVRLAGCGDKAAFGRLVARHQRRLLAVAMRSLGNRMAAEDVVQDVFTRAWVNAPKWQSRETGHGASYAAWLSRVTVNLCVDQSRKPRQAPLDDAHDPVDPSPGADQGLIERQAAEHLREAIAALPERQRLAIALTYDAEMSNADGAAAMNTTVGAFELLLVRARRALRASLLDGAKDVNR